MLQHQTKMRFHTHGAAFLDITAAVSDWLFETGIRDGLLTLHIMHTSASLVIQENADPDVLSDLRDALAFMAPTQGRSYRHTAEGADDMPAHIKSAVTNSNLSIPVSNRLPCLGTWQGIFIAEHREQPHSRTVAIHLIGN